MGASKTKIFKIIDQYQDYVKSQGSILKRHMNKQRDIVCIKVVIDVRVHSNNLMQQLCIRRTAEDQEPNLVVLKKAAHAIQRPNFHCVEIVAEIGHELQGCDAHTKP